MMRQARRSSRGLLWSGKNENDHGGRHMWTGVATSIVGAIGRGCRALSCAQATPYARPVEARCVSTNNGTPLNEKEIDYYLDPSSDPRVVRSWLALADAGDHRYSVEPCPACAHPSCRAPRLGRRRGVPDRRLCRALCKLNTKGHAGSYSIGWRPSPQTLSKFFPNGRHPHDRRPSHSCHH